MFEIIKSLFRILGARGATAAEELEGEYIEDLAGQSIREAKESYEEVKGEYAAALAELEKNRRLLAEREDEVKKLNAAAEKAMAAGDEDLARRCLERALPEEEGARTLAKNVHQLETRVAELKDTIQKYKVRIGEAEREKRILVARKQVAESSQRVQDAMNRVSTKANAFSAMERLKDSVTDAEARVSAERELAADAEDDLDRQIDELSDQDALDARMQALRQKLGTDDGDEQETAGGEGTAQPGS